jgi:hypothetical protein
MGQASLRTFVLTIAQPALLGDRQAARLLCSLAALPVVARRGKLRVMEKEAS